MRPWLLIVPFVVACGGSSPARPSPQPFTVTGLLTDTVSGEALGTFSQTVPALPAFLTLTTPGHLARQARVTAQGQVVDLIPDAAPFDLAFYRQLARGTLEGEAQPLRVLSAAPALYLQTAGLSAANVAALEQAARAAVPALTGERFQVTTWETGAAARAEQAGWIVIEMESDAHSPLCGRSYLGASAGHIWINLGRSCDRVGTIAHELGHAFGFYHIAATDGLMSNPHRPEIVLPSTAERYHAAIAYKRTAGNRDPDVDP